MNTLPTLQHQVSLQSCNTFGIDAIADDFILLETLTQIEDLYRAWKSSTVPRARLFLGGGSNLILSDRISALVVKVALQGRQIVAQTNDHTIVAAAAGESWHEFVQWTISQGLGGLENLSLIPGTVGAAPIQNIGAYGRELKDFFYRLTAFDFEMGEFRQFSKEECQFAYRDSIFKSESGKRFLITEVQFALPRVWKPEISYGDVAQQLQKKRGGQFTPQDVSEVICAIRQSKLPDPKQIGNAGSFFKNPVVSRDLRDQIVQAYPLCVSYPVEGGHFKLAAGWLIEQCGWKGKSLERVGVYEKQALVLVNRGGATGEDVRQLAAQIQAEVARKFSVSLEIEPVFI